MARSTKLLAFWFCIVLFCTFETGEAKHGMVAFARGLGGKSNDDKKDYKDDDDDDDDDDEYEKAPPQQQQENDNSGSVAAGVLGTLAVLGGLLAGLRYSKRKNQASTLPEDLGEKKPQQDEDNKPRRLWPFNEPGSFFPRSSIKVQKQTAAPDDPKTTVAMFAIPLGSIPPVPERSSKASAVYPHSVAASNPRYSAGSVPQAQWATQSSYPRASQASFASYQSHSYHPSRASHATFASHPSHASFASHASYASHGTYASYSSHRSHGSYASRGSGISHSSQTPRSGPGHMS